MDGRRTTASNSGSSEPDNTGAPSLRSESSLPDDRSRQSIAVNTFVDSGADDVVVADRSRQRRLALFLAAKATSDVGEALDFVVLSVFVWERTESALATGFVSVAAYFGAIVGGRLGHRYGAHWDRRRAMIVADVVRMSVLLALALLPEQTQIWWLYISMLLLGVGHSVFDATLSAATPVLAPKRTQLLNSVLSGLKGAALMVGTALATIAVPVVGYRGVFALDAASYALSGLVVFAVRMQLREDGGSGDEANIRLALRTGIIAAGLVPLLVVRCLDAFGSSSQHVGLPILGRQVAGSAWSLWAGGLLVGSFVLRPFVTRLISRAPEVVFCLATIVMSVGFVGVFWVPGLLPRLAAAALAGVGDAISEIAFKQAVQRLPDDERGPAFGLAQIVVNSGFMSGLIVTSLLLNPDWVAEWVLLLHSVPMLAAGAAVVHLRRQS